MYLRVTCLYVAPGYLEINVWPHLEQMSIAEPKKKKKKRHAMH